MVCFRSVGFLRRSRCCWAALYHVLFFNNFDLYQYVIVFFYELSYNKRDKKANGFESVGWLSRLLVGSFN